MAAMANRQVRLYYVPISYYSQKALIALHEKGIKFEKAIVDINKGEQIEPWYMRLAPKGVIPTLQHGETIVTDSEKIVDYIDREFPAGTKLVPDADTEIGKETAKWRQIIDDYPMVPITYGIMCYLDLSVTGMKVPSAFLKKREAILKGYETTLKKLEQLANEHPDLREAYLAKKAESQKLAARISLRENAEKAMAELEASLDQVEEQLRKVDAEKVAGSENPARGIWLCGQQFTAADINLCLVLARLDFVGLDQRYHGVDKRFTLHLYWEGAKKYPSVRQGSVNAMREMVKLTVKQNSKIICLVVVGIILLAGAIALAVVFA